MFRLWHFLYYIYLDTMGYPMQKEDDTAIVIGTVVSGNSVELFTNKIDHFDSKP